MTETALHTLTDKSETMQKIAQGSSTKGTAEMFTDEVYFDVIASSTPISHAQCII